MYYGSMSQVGAEPFLLTYLGLIKAYDILYSLFNHNMDGF